MFFKSFTARFISPSDTPHEIEPCGGGGLPGNHNRSRGKLRKKKCKFHPLHLYITIFVCRIQVKCATEKNFFIFIGFFVF